MKTIFNQSDANELLGRVEAITPESKALWGKMDVAQMLAHTARAAQMALGEIETRKATFPVSLIGRLVKSRILGESPMHKNSPTAPEVKIIDPRDFQKEKTNLTEAIKRLNTGGEQSAKAPHHPFLGKLTTQEWGRIQYKHIDHHLKQFGG